MKVLISGGSGFVGHHLSASLVAGEHEVVVLTRGSAGTESGVRYVSWDAKSPDGSWISELSNTGAVVNLAGTSIGRWPWTRRNMAEMIASRLSATGALVAGIERQVRRPSVLVNASGIDYYGNRVDEMVVTEDGSPGDSFLARLSQQWEAAAQKASALGVRVVCVRTATALGREAPAFRLLTLPFRFFVGGPLGNGRQWFTWIHIDDLVGIYQLALTSDRLSGPINATAPDVRRQRDVAREIGRVLHRSAVFPAPAVALRLALGRMADLLLDGRRAAPAKARASGYAFRFANLPQALEDLLVNR